MKTNIAHYVMVIFGTAVVSFMVYDSIANRGSASVVSNLTLGERTLCHEGIVVSTSDNLRGLYPIRDEKGNTKPCVQP